jgi:hypothetical protein
MIKRPKHDGPRILSVLADICKILGTVVIVIIDWTHH